MMTFLTKNIMTFICQIEFDIKNIWMRETYLHVEIHTMCVNCRYYGEKTISPSAIRISSNTAKEAERKKFLKNGCVCVYIYVIFKILLFLLSYESI